MSPLRTRAHRGALAALLVTTALAAAACGGSSSSSSSTTSTTAAASTTSTTTTASGAGAATGVSSAALAAYTACLKKNGVTLPTGGAPPGGTGGTPPANGGTPPTGTTGGAPSGQRPARSAAFTKAMTACASLRPAGMQAGPGGGPGGAGGQNSAAFAAYRNCLTLHGVKTATQIGPGATLTASEKKAVSSCASLRPKLTAPTSTTASS